MATEDTSQIKNKIVQTLKFKGAMLPAYIAKEVGLDMLLTSAFLSELISEKKIKASYMRVGSSAIYYLSENFQDLEKYAEHLKSKEKEAFKLLKEKQFLEDEKQEPAIRVALRQLRDFAFPFEVNEKIIWRYFIIPKVEYKKQEKNIEIILKKPTIKTPEKENAKEINIFDKKVEVKEKLKLKKKIIKKSASAKKSEQFFNKVKEFLTKKQKEITDILGVTKDTLTLKIKHQSQEILLIAFNKKRITEIDIIKTHKKAQELGLKYQILSLGEPSKKLDNLINAIKDLSEIEKIQ